jgi:hypothetical protein
VRFTLPVPNQIRGRQLLAEIKTALSVNNIDYVFYPPSEVDVIGITAAQAATVTTVIANHVPNPTYFPDEQDASQSLQTLQSAAQSTVGVAAADWTNIQMRALLALLIWKAGGLDKDTKVKPLAQWVRS